MGNNLRKEYKKGTKVKLDKDRHDPATVEVISQTPNKLFTTVSSNGGKNTWDVMTIRLSEI